MIRVAVSILNYKNSQTTIECVQSVLASSFTFSTNCILDVFVCDNNSGVESQDHLQESLANLPNIHLQFNDGNKGFAAGHNGNLVAIQHGSAPDYVWILNNDCQVHESALDSLITCAQKHPGVGIWGATLLEMDGATIQCAGGCFYNSWLSSYRRHGHGRPLTQVDKLSTVKFDYIAGASLFMPLSTLQTGLHSPPLATTRSGDVKTQWFNEDFFLYFEELDLASRLNPGLEMAWCRAALIKHSGGASTGASDQHRSPLAEYHATLSALKYTRLYFPKRLWFMLPARYIAKCLQLLVRRDLRLVESLTRAYRDFWNQ